jgi:hypothetical protein
MVVIVWPTSKNKHENSLKDDAESEHHRLRTVNRHFHSGIIFPVIATNISYFIITIFSFMTQCLHLTETEIKTCCRGVSRDTVIVYKQHTNSLFVKERFDAMVNILAPYLGSPGLEYRPRDQPSWHDLLDFLRNFKQILRGYFKIFYIVFSPKFFIHERPVIRRLIKCRWVNQK